MEAKDKCDITISIDCDGQDDINAMNEMVDEYLEGSEIVYGVRSKRDTDTFFKRATAEGFYKVLTMQITDLLVVEFLMSLLILRKLIFSLEECFHL